MAITYGYVRVSAADQNEARQIDAMAHAGVERTNVVIEKQSGTPGIGNVPQAN